MFTPIITLRKIVSDITSPAKAVVRRAQSPKALKGIFTPSVLLTNAGKPVAIISEVSALAITQLAFDDTNKQTPVRNPPSYEIIKDISAVPAEPKTSLTQPELAHDLDVKSVASVDSDTVSVVSFAISDSDSDSDSEDDWEDAIDGEGDDLPNLVARFHLMDSKDEQHIFNCNQLALGKKASPAPAIVHVELVDDSDDEDSDEEEEDDGEISQEEIRAAALAALVEARARIGRSRVFQLSCRAPLADPCDEFTAPIRRAPRAKEPKSRRAPSVLGGLGRSSRLRESWTADDF